MSLELFATPTCPYCAEVRERLEWDGCDFVEYDVEGDRNALVRLTALCGPHTMVPVLVEDGCVIEIGAAGRGCYVSSG